MNAPVPPTPSQKARVFEPFAKVWTPRTPDSSYDSFGVLQPAPPMPPIVQAPLVSDQMSHAVGSQGGTYAATTVSGNGNERAGVGIVLHSGTYTAP